MVRVTPKRLVRALNVGKAGSFKPRLRGFPRRLINLLGKESNELHARAKTRHNAFHDQMHDSAHALFRHLNEMRKDRHFFPLQHESMDVDPARSELYLSLKAHGAKDPEKALPYAQKLLAARMSEKNKTGPRLVEQRLLQAFVEDARQFVENTKEVAQRAREKEKVERVHDRYIRFRNSNAFWAYRLVRAMARHHKVIHKDGKTIEGRLWKRLPGFSLAFAKRYLTQLSALSSEIDVLKSQLARDQKRFEEIKDLRETSDDIERRILLSTKIAGYEKDLAKKTAEFERVADEFNQKYPDRYSWNKDVRAAVREFES